jgi:hypothetical protein
MERAAQQLVQSGKQRSCTLIHQQESDSIVADLAASRVHNPQAAASWDGMCALRLMTLLHYIATSVLTRQSCQMLLLLMFEWYDCVAACAICCLADCRPLSAHERDTSSCAAVLLVQYSQLAVEGVC